MTTQGVRVPSEHQNVVYPLMEWWQFTNRTAQALVSLYDQGYTVEAASLMRNLMGHAYATGSLRAGSWLLSRSPSIGVSASGLWPGT
ncbi:hypothetical protein [Streptomyces collinus]|uniref:hypothetical protein n=1 Tax=Streptomyces collinus TaxID=42684 RepID=UPI0033DD956B